MCLKYMEKVKNKQNFRFCAIPQVMAVGTLALCFNNHKVFTGEHLRQQCVLGLIADAIGRTGTGSSHSCLAGVECWTAPMLLIDRGLQGHRVLAALPLEQLHGSKISLLVANHSTHHACLVGEWH